VTAIVFLFFASPTFLAEGAQSSRYYARAINYTAYFFSQKDTSFALFAVPYTYCIEVLQEDGDWYYCKYAEDFGAYKALYGYCKKADFLKESSTPQTIYLYKTIYISYRPQDTTLALPVLNEITVEAAFYGTYYAGATAYSYVLSNNSFGYISGANDDYPLNDIIDETVTIQEQTTNEDTTPILTAIVLAALCVAAIILIYFAARRKTR
jgi:hypothetical protein